MKELRTAIVYLPNGNQRLFTTSPNVNKIDPSYQLVDRIEGEPEMLNVVFMDGDRMESESFVRIPYIFQLTTKK